MHMHVLNLVIIKYTLCCAYKFNFTWYLLQVQRKYKEVKLKDDGIRKEEREKKKANKKRWEGNKK